MQRHDSQAELLKLIADNYRGSAAEHALLVRLIEDRDQVESEHRKQLEDIRCSFFKRRSVRWFICIPSKLECSRGVRPFMPFEPGTKKWDRCTLPKGSVTAESVED